MNAPRIQIVLNSSPTIRLATDGKHVRFLWDRRSTEAFLVRGGKGRALVVRHARIGTLAVSVYRP
jgi:hypothetical protein